MSSNDEPTSNVDAPSDYDQSVCTRFENECTCMHTLAAHGDRGCAPMYCECPARWDWVTNMEV